jgi:hypothetical protein
MKIALYIAGIAALSVAGLAAVAPRACAQVPPVLVPIVVDTAVPIVVNAVKPKPKNVGLVKFQGYIMNANTAQVTVRAKGNDMAVRSFALSQPAASKMQHVIDSGGYQYGDKITVYYDPQSQQAMNFKGKPSRPL